MATNITVKGSDRITVEIGSKYSLDSIVEMIVEGLKNMEMEKKND